MVRLELGMDAMSPVLFSINAVIVAVVTERG